MSKSDPAAKQEVEEIVAKVVGAIVGDAMQLISNRIEVMESKLDEVVADLNRIENKLDPTVDKVDDHEVRLNQLQHKIA